MYRRLTTGSMCGIHETSHPQNLMSMQINSQNLEHGVAMNNFDTIDTVHKLDGWLDHSDGSLPFHRWTNG